MEFSAKNHLSKRHCFQSEAIKTFICEFFATCWTSHAEMCILECVEKKTADTHAYKTGNEGDRDRERSPLHCIAMEK